MTPLIRDSGVVNIEEPAREVVVSGWWRFQQLHSGTREERKQLEVGELSDGAVSSSTKERLARWIR
jgi:hypothetical protein